MPRTFIFLFDGTGNDPTEATVPEPTNIFKLNPLISESRTIQRRQHSQVTFYSPGIGTKFYEESFLGRRKQIWFGSGIDEMVMRAYVNLASNYRSGDQIVAVGFSRGGIAARLFVRLISDFGLLQARNISQFSNKLEIFNTAIDRNFLDYSTEAQVYKEEMRQLLHDTPKIGFLGVFDCCSGPVDDEYFNFLTVIDHAISQNVGRYLHLMSLHEMRGHFLLWRLRSDQNSGREIWMPGVHSDVGGGYQSDLISRISLLTMAIELSRSTGVALDKQEVSSLKEIIQSLIIAGSVSINKDSNPIGYTKSRSEFVRQGDRVHYFHHWLIGKEVYWKEEQKEIYKNKFPKILTVDRETKKMMIEIIRN